MGVSSKYVNALFLLGSAIVWLLVKSGVSTLIGRFQLGRVLGSSVDLLLHGLPVLAAIAFFIWLRSNHKIVGFSVSAMTELSQVHWPSQKELRMGTIVVIITVLLTGIALGGVDLAFSSIVRAMIGAS